MESIPAVGPRGVSCAKCCSIFSASGVVFLAFLGHLLKVQRLYIVGVDHPMRAANQCFAAAWIYASCIIVSILVLVYDKLRGSDPRSESDYRRSNSDLRFADGLTDRQNRLLETLERPRHDRDGSIEMLPQGTML
mmetsp:Transcript_2109/g.6441  ORF Transcript_2109/g.6441 Transcript_2109/m.6441 type:complete len:135 (-) Transcript_2109:414-818(-)